MARFRIARQPIRRARIEIVPMIDTIFFLLVFFLVTSLSMVKMKGMAVSLPKDSASPAKPPLKAIVHVDWRGAYFLNAQKIDPTSLRGSLQKLVSSNPQTEIIVDVDKTRNVQTLITVMDSVNQVTTPSGVSPAVMVATSPVDSRGNALTAYGRQ